MPCHLTFLLGIVQLVEPVQLLVDRPSAEDGEGTNELLKIYGSISVIVEGLEEEVGVVFNIAVREEFAELFAENLLVDDRVGRSLFESAIDGPHFVLGEVRFIHHLKCIKHS
ncbi:hypothetical protein PENTCL1PPCAC_29371 [Pristionchus entomophagus]|uniref:Uncharacterized protein n=1 Tax=Pristionchus entomophagus TaxID=358040 RepID=A0AAV5ULM0_9BILA|nr:hypothetical protein PENTCL1PPCAC_29371 [Pristionchus entomophagus]